MILWISTNFMNFKLIEKNDHNTRSFKLLSIQTPLFILLYFFMGDRGRGEREREREREER